MHDRFAIAVLGGVLLWSPVAAALEVSRCQVSLFSPDDGISLTDRLDQGEAISSNMMDCGKIALGFDPRPLRVSFSVQRSMDEAGSFVVMIDYPPLDHLAVRIDDEVKVTGSMHAYASRSIPSRFFSFPLSFREGELSKTVEIVAQTSSSLQLPISVKSDVEYVRTVRTEYIALGLYYGAILALILYNLFIFMMVRERAYLYYILYGLCYLTFQMTLNGISFEFLWPNLPMISKPIFPIMIGFIFGFIFLFMRNFMSLALTNPRLDRLTLGLAILSFAISPIVFVTDLRTAVVSTVGYSMIAAFVILLIGIAAARGGNRIAQIFLLAWTVFLSGIVLIGLKNFGLLPNSFITDYAMQIGSVAEMILLSFGLGYRVRRAEQDKLAAIEEKNMAEKKSTEYHAIARTTQMLAHDVRKPFTLLKIALNRLGAIGNDPGGVRDFVIKVQRHVGLAYEDVDNLISDVLEIGSEGSNLQKAPCSLRSLIQSSLRSVFRYDKRRFVEFEFALQHENSINVDAKKMKRVFSNIFDNARHSIDKSGKIWVRSTESKKAGYISVTIGNTGDLIPEQNISRLFDAFFTSGKRGGTGLGLAICHRIVEAHGGTIACRSTPEIGTEFTFTMPVSSISDPVAVELPVNSKEVCDQFEKSLGKGSSPDRDGLEVARYRQALARAKALGRPLQVLIVDDEPMYAAGIIDHLKANTVESHCVEVAVAENAVQGLAHCNGENFDLIICDIDLGKGEMSGFDLVERVRSSQAGARICIHSNRNSSKDYRDAVEVGADAFLPKPLTASHFWSLLAEGRNTVFSVDESPSHASQEGH